MTNTLLLVLTVLLVLNRLARPLQARASTVLNNHKNRHLLKQLQALKLERRSLAVKRDAVSAQNEYAKWTKLNRQIDALNLKIAQHEKAIAANSSGNLAGFGVLVTALLKLPLLALPLYYYNLELFSINVGWFPHWLKWLLALPKNRVGTIGISSFMFLFERFLNGCAVVVEELLV